MELYAPFEVIDNKDKKVCTVGYVIFNAETLDIGKSMLGTSINEIIKDRLNRVALESKLIINQDTEFSINTLCKVYNSRENLLKYDSLVDPRIKIRL